MWDQATLEQRLRKIEALFAGTTSDGEREAARLAAERIRARLADWRRLEGDVAMTHSLHDPWERSTTTPCGPSSEFRALADELHKALAELTARVIRETIHADVSDAVEEPKQLAGLERNTDCSIPNRIIFLRIAIRNANRPA